MDDREGTGGSTEVPADRMRHPFEGKRPCPLAGAFDFAETTSSVHSLQNGPGHGALDALFNAEVVDDMGFVLLAARRNPSYSARVHEEERSRTRFAQAEEADNGRTASARALSFLREMQGYTQKMLAEASGIHNATISAYERGRRTIGERNLRNMLEALGLPVRAWDATVRHIEWLDWMARRRKEARDEASPSEGFELALAMGTADGSDLRREIEHVAEAAGREREQTVTRVLELLLRAQR